MADRWKVRECACGHLTADTRGFLCERCAQVLGDEFEVVRAAAARRSDPTTSKKAGAMNAPGRDSLRGRALEAIRLSGERGLTAREVQTKTGIEGIWKRISELKQGGYIRATGTRTDPGTGAESDVFVVTSRLRG
jgi:hypothetical protein